MQAVDYIQFTGGRTNTASALKMVHSRILTQANGDRVNVPNYLYIITDGNSNINAGNTIPEAIATRLLGTYTSTTLIFDAHIIVHLLELVNMTK